MPTSTPKEGDQVTYRCSSTGRPAPKLTLSYGGTSVPEGEIQHLPTVDSITLDSPETTTVLTWTTSAKKQMNKKSLMCEVYDHPTTERRLSSRTMTVYCKLTNGKKLPVELFVVSLALGQHFYESFSEHWRLVLFWLASWATESSLSPHYYNVAVFVCKENIPYSLST